MYLPKGERKDIMIAYGHKDAVEKDHYEIGPDTWIYLFENNEAFKETFNKAISWK